MSLPAPHDAVSPLAEESFWDQARDVRDYYLAGSRPDVAGWLRVAEGDLRLAYAALLLDLPRRAALFMTSPPPVWALLVAAAFFLRWS